MTKLRIKANHDCFEGTYFVIQKRVAFFFWCDISGWIHDINKAIDIKDALQSRFDSGDIE